MRGRREDEVIRRRVGATIVAASASCAFPKCCNNTTLWTHHASVFAFKPIYRRVAVTHLGTSFNRRTGEVHSWTSWGSREDYVGATALVRLRYHAPSQVAPTLRKSPPLRMTRTNREVCQIFGMLNLFVPSAVHSRPRLTSRRLFTLSPL